MRTFRLTLMTLLMCCGVLCAQPKDDPAQLLRAVVHYVEGRYDAAYGILRNLHEESPDNDAVNYYLGLSAYALEKNAEAEQFLQAAVQLDSTNRWYLETLGTLYRNKGDRSAFAVTCETLLERFPAQYNTPYTHCVIGDEMMDRRLPDEALQHYDKALEMDPGYAPAQLGKMELHRMQGDMMHFFPTLRQFIDNNNVRDGIKVDYLKALVEKMDARFYWMWGGELRGLVGKCYRSMPENTDIKLLQMQMHMIEGQNDSLLSVSRDLARYAESIGDVDNQAIALNVEADLLHEAGNKAATYKLYDRILSIKPDYAPVLNNYAYYLATDGKKLRKALKMSTKCIELEPDNATYLDTHGWILYLLKRPEEAKPHFKRAMIYGGKDSDVVLEHYSKVLEALGEDSLATYYRNLAEQKRSSGR